MRLVKNEGRWDSLKRWIGNSIRRIARSSHNWPDPIVVRSRPSSIRHEFQAQFPAPTIELWGRPEPGWRSLHEADQQISQMLAPGRLLELLQGPRIIAAAVTNPRATPMKGLSAANQKERFQSGFSGVEFLFMNSSQAFKHRHFTKREMSCPF